MRNFGEITGWRRREGNTKDFGQDGRCGKYTVVIRGRWIGAWESFGGYAVLMENLESFCVARIEDRADVRLEGTGRRGSHLILTVLGGRCSY